MLYVIHLLYMVYKSEAGIMTLYTLSGTRRTII